MSILGRTVTKAKSLVGYQARRHEIQSRGIEVHPPNYLYIPSMLGRGHVAIDVGCADDPDFSSHLIRQFGVRAWGVDPTRKHAAALRKAELDFRGSFQFLPLAVASKSGTLTFFESQENSSGSLLADHGNVANDTISAYDVEAVDLLSLLERIGEPAADILKLDLEGAEYELLSEVRKEDLRPFRQILVEFHHHCIRHFNERDTTNCVNRLIGLGFEAHTLNGRDYLFL